MTLVPNAQHISEFYGGFNGTCTQTSAAVVMASALGTPTDRAGTINLMLLLTHDMIDKHMAGPNGAATVGNMAAELRSKGVEVDTEWDYQEPLAENWEQFLNDTAGIKPILLQIATAYNAVDINGIHYNNGVHYHAIAIVGKEVSGYIVADPNVPTIEENYVIYTVDTLRAMTPCGLIAANVVRAAPEPAAPLAANDVRVEQGNTLSGIAQDHHDTLQAVEASNPQIANPNLIYPGEVVHLPSQEQQPAPPPPVSQDVTVEQGNTLSGIAQEHNDSLQAVEAANPQIANPDLIYPGEVVHLPA